MSLGIAAIGGRGWDAGQWTTWDVDDERSGREILEEEKVGVETVEPRRENEPERGVISNVP